MSASTRVGTEIAGYRLEKVVGRGGMSCVYLAEHIRLGRKVALKVLASALSEDEGYRERFIHESRRAAELEHPNIIPIYDAGDDDGQLYIAMRYVEGSDLKAIIKRDGSLPLGRTLFILEQVADALDAAHERDLVHRDVKPSNILVSEPSDRVYLTDFGVVKHTTSRGLTKTGFFIGTVDYAPPEQIEGLPLDPRTDVYALGCVLYECLTGRAPFDREGEVAVLHAHLTEPPPPITVPRPDVPKALNEVIATAMAKSKDDRYGACEDLIVAARTAALQRPTTMTSQPREMEPRAAVPVVGASTVPPPAEPTTVPEPTPPSELALPPPPAPVSAGRGDTPPQTAAPVQPPPGAPGSAPVTPAIQANTEWPPSIALPAAGGQGIPPAANSQAGGGRVRGPRRQVSLVAAFGIAAIAVLLVGGGAVAGVLLTRDNSNSPSTAAMSGSPPQMTSGGSAHMSGNTLRAIVPMSLFATCNPEPAVAAGAVETMSCAPPDRADHLELVRFKNRSQMAVAYREKVRASGVQMQSGRCSTTSWNAEGSWEHAMGEMAADGRVLCYFMNGNSYIVWTVTASDVLATAMKQGEFHGDLFRWWRFWHHQLA